MKLSEGEGEREGGREGETVSISRPPFDQCLIPKRINGRNQRPFVAREICQLILYIYIYIDCFREVV